MSIKEKPPDYFKSLKTSLKSILKHPDINAEPVRGPNTCVGVGGVRLNRVAERRQPVLVSLVIGEPMVVHGPGIEH